MNHTCCGIRWFGGRSLLSSCHIHSRRFYFSKRATKSTCCCSWLSLDSHLASPQGPGGSRTLSIWWQRQPLLVLSFSSTTIFPGNGWSLLPSTSPGRRGHLDVPVPSESPVLPPNGAALISCCFKHRWQGKCGGIILPMEGIHSRATKPLLLARCLHTWWMSLSM